VAGLDRPPAHFGSIRASPIGVHAAFDCCLMATKRCVVRKWRSALSAAPAGFVLPERELRRISIPTRPAAPRGKVSALHCAPRRVAFSRGWRNMISGMPAQARFGSGADTTGERHGRTGNSGPRCPSEGDKER